MSKNLYNNRKIFTLFTFIAFSSTVRSIQASWSFPANREREEVKSLPSLQRTTVQRSVANTLLSELESFKKHQNFSGKTQTRQSVANVDSTLKHGKIYKIQCCSSKRTNKPWKKLFGKNQELIEVFGWNHLVNSQIVQKMESGSCNHGWN